VLREDLQAALVAWLKTPLLPVFSVGIAMASSGLGLRGIGGWLGIFLGLLGIGWLGTERLWYQRVFEGTGVSVAELWLATWRYFPRFFVLALLLVVPLIPTMVWARIAGGVTSPIRLVASVTAAILSVLVVFVLPALAFTTTRVREGLRIGIRILREDWSRCRWYALFPALAAVAAERLSVLETAVPGTVWTVLSAVALVAFDGAVVRYYLRRERSATT
jgi:hypothetical protein